MMTVKKHGQEGTPLRHTHTSEFYSSELLVARSDHMPGGLQKYRLNAILAHFQRTLMLPIFIMIIMGNSAQEGHQDPHRGHVVRRSAHTMTCQLTARRVNHLLYLHPLLILFYHLLDRLTIVRMTMGTSWLH